MPRTTGVFMTDEELQAVYDGLGELQSRAEAAEAKLERLQCIVRVAAPHGMGCYSIQDEFYTTPEWGSIEYCDCWKRKILLDSESGAK